jgi:hypothetical protein
LVTWQKAQGGIAGQEIGLQQAIYPNDLPGAARTYSPNFSPRGGSQIAGTNPQKPGNFRGHHACGGCPPHFLRHL